MVKISWGEAEERLLKTHEGRISLVAYSASSVDATFHCNVCGYEWDAQAFSVMNSGNGCPDCYELRRSETHRAPIEEVRGYIESHECHLISDEYVNGKIPIKIQFSCGHIQEMRFDVFKRGSRCRQCGIKKSNLGKRIPDKIFGIVKDLGFTFIEFPTGYINRLSDIKYECDKGHVVVHKIREFVRIKKCKECSRIECSTRQMGNKGNNWQGGKTVLRNSLKTRASEWRDQSMDACNYKCVITGGCFHAVHHLHSFHEILSEALENLGYDQNETTGEYSQDELESIYDECCHVHTLYPLGVCLRKDIHVLFHKLYGNRNNTPDQFYEFTERIQSGEIKVRKKKQ